MINSNTTQIAGWSAIWLADFPRTSPRSIPANAPIRSDAKGFRTRPGVRRKLANSSTSFLSRASRRQRAYRHRRGSRFPPGSFHLKKRTIVRNFVSSPPDGAGAAGRPSSAQQVDGSGRPESLRCTGVICPLSFKTKPPTPIALLPWLITCRASST